MHCGPSVVDVAIARRDGSSCGLRDSPHHVLIPGKNRKSLKFLRHHPSNNKFKCSSLTPVRYAELGTDRGCRAVH